MTDAELISRWMAGDLPPDEAHAVRARLDAEPELRAVWHALQAMDADLGRLPTDAPPPGLDAEVLRKVASVPRAVPAASPVRTPAIAWIALGLAAGVALSLGARAVSFEPERMLQLDTGTLTVAGEASVATSAAKVKVEGRAQVTAGLGWVEVRVLEGQAHIDDQDGVTWVYGGETRRVGDSARAGRPASPAAASADLDQLRAEIAALRLQSAADQKMLDAAKGRLALLEGAPQSWPVDLADALRPKAFAAHAAEVATRLGTFRVTDVVCDEYPCVAVFAGPPGGGQGQADALVTAMNEGAPELADRWQMSTERVDDERGPDLLVIALSVANGPASPDLDARVKYRLEGEIQSALEDIP